MGSAWGNWDPREGQQPFRPNPNGAGDRTTTLRRRLIGAVNFGPRVFNISAKWPTMEKVSRSLLYCLIQCNYFVIDHLWLGPKIKPQKQKHQPRSAISSYYTSTALTFLRQLKIFMYVVASLLLQWFLNRFFSTTIENLKTEFCSRSNFKVAPAPAPELFSLSHSSSSSSGARHH